MKDVAGTGPFGGPGGHAVADDTKRRQDHSIFHESA